MVDSNEWHSDEAIEESQWYSTEVATLGDRLVALREQAQLSQADLSRKLGVKKSTLVAWEEDRNEPRANRLQMLSGILGVSLKWLLTGEGDEVDFNADPQDAIDVAMLTEIREIRAQLLASTNRLAYLEKRLRKGSE
jgi:transcriptional regulator with XRE-family HTH domain